MSNERRSKPSKDKAREREGERTMQCGEGSNDGMITRRTCSLIGGYFYFLTWREGLPLLAPVPARNGGMTKTMRRASRHSLPYQQRQGVYPEDVDDVAAGMGVDCGIEDVAGGDAVAVGTGAEGVLLRHGSKEASHRSRHLLRPCQSSRFQSSRPPGVLLPREKSTSLSVYILFFMRWSTWLDIICITLPPKNSDGGLLNCGNRERTKMSRAVTTLACNRVGIVEVQLLVIKE